MMKKIITLLVIVVSLNSNNILAQKIAVGSAHSLVVCKDSTVWAWGSNEFGQLGNGTLESSTVPVKVQGLSGVVAVFAGGYGSFALRENGELWVWGNNNDRNLFTGDSFNIPLVINTPMLVSLTNVKKVFNHGTLGGMLSVTFSYAITNDSSSLGSRLY
jgi:alpha-tubulin suppressor-like RCC1 family protein